MLRSAVPTPADAVFEMAALRPAAEQVALPRVGADVCHRLTPQAFGAAIGGIDAILVRVPQPNTRQDAWLVRIAVVAQWRYSRGRPMRTASAIPDGRPDFAEQYGQLGRVVSVGRPDSVPRRDAVTGIAYRMHFRSVELLIAALRFAVGANAPPRCGGRGTAAARYLRQARHGRLNQFGMAGQSLEKPADYACVEYGVAKSAALPNLEVGSQPAHQFHVTAQSQRVLDLVRNARHLAATGSGGRPVWWSARKRANSGSASGNAGIRPQSPQSSRDGAGADASANVKCPAANRNSYFLRMKPLSGTPHRAAIFIICSNPMSYLIVAGLQPVCCVLAAFWRAPPRAASFRNSIWSWRIRARAAASRATA